MNPNPSVPLRSTVRFVVSLACALGAVGSLRASLPPPPEKVAVEQELLAQARENIERIRKSDIVVRVTDPAGAPIAGARVEAEQITHAFLFGNLSEEVFDFPPELAEKFQARFLDLFNFTELTVKWGRYEPTQGRTEWRRLQEKLDWCRQHGVVAKGHTIGWTNLSGTPGWLLRLPPDRATELYRAHVWNLVSAFKDQIRMWDVVNEPVTTVPWEIAIRDREGEQGILEGSRYKVAGITLEQTLPWVENSFRWAEQADPTGDFHLNEFYIIAKPEVREKFHRLLSELLARGVRVTGIGIQAHEPRTMWFPPREILATFDRFADLKLPIHITEFIPQSSGKPIIGGWREGVWTEEAQAEFAEHFYTLAFGHPGLVSIHWWGLSDGRIWLPGGGLLDADMNPKPVYTRLHRLIKNEWMTKDVRLQTDHAGQTSFRGFLGRYRVRIVLPDGRETVVEKQLAGPSTEPWHVSL